MTRARFGELRHRCIGCNNFRRTRAEKLMRVAALLQYIELARARAKCSERASECNELRPSSPGALLPRRARSLVPSLSLYSRELFALGLYLSLSRAHTYIHIFTSLSNVFFLRVFMPRGTAAAATAVFI